MSKLDTIQHIFFNTVSTPGNATSDIEASLAHKISQNNANERMAIYRNNYFAGLRDILGEIFPATRSIVGEASFNALSTKYFSLTQPEAANMQMLASDFDEFLTKQPIFESLPYLGDLAKLEWHYNAAYYAKNSASIDISVLQELAPSELADSRIGLQEALFFFDSDFAILDIWQHCHLRLEGKKIGANDLTGIDKAQSIAIFCFDNEVSIAETDAGLNACFNALRNYATLEQSLNEGLRNAEDFDPQLAVSFIASHELIVRITESENA